MEEFFRAFFIALEQTLRTVISFRIHLLTKIEES